MRRIILCLVLFFVAQSVLAQPAVRGKVNDTLNKKALENAVVSLLKKSDSTLFRFIRTDKEGKFSFPGISPGKYMLLVTYPKFVDYTDEVEVKSSSVDMGSISLTLKSHLMAEVVIRQNLAIRMKGDTIEYKADSFRVAEGASVKELLRKLPGMQLDKNGQIIAQGEKVEKVLVDGEEFFSDDPAVVIENLRADAIDKVQSYDKKSDQSEFTGVDDGSRSKTLNLVLKEDRKRGYLGKIVIGSGSEERYSNEAMLNYFKGKKKLSVYGIVSNTGKTGLGWEDRGKFGAGNDFGDAEIEMGAGFIMINSNGDDDFSDWENSYRDEGIPKSIKAGAHASNKWNGDKQSINGNYTIKDIKVDAEGNSLYKYLLPDSAYYSKENHKSYSTQRQQMLSGIYDVKMDSLSSLRFKINGKLDSRNVATSSNTETDDEDLVMVNNNGRLNTSKSDQKVFLGSALWRQKFRKKGRTISLSASYKTGETSSNGFLNSGTEFYKDGLLVRTDSINQYKTSIVSSNTANSKFVYTEPAGKKGVFELNYTVTNVVSNSNRKSFDRLNGKYEALNPLFSNKYELHYFANSGGIKYQYNGKKLSANLGSNIGASSYTQKDSLGREVGRLQYTNLFPASRIAYRFAPQKSLNLTYTGSPQSPTIQQVQPIRENTNPLFITIGNPQLEQAFRHNISLFFTDFKVLTGRSIWINGSFSPVQNAIVTSQDIDSGITRQRYINTNGNYNYWFYTSYGFKLGKTDMNVGLNMNTNGSRYVNFVNGAKNANNQRALGIGFNLNKYKENKYDFGVSAGFDHNRNSSNNGSRKNSFWSQNHNLSANYYFTKNFQVGTDADLRFRQKTDAFTGNNNFAVWNANIAYKIFKKRNGIFKLEMNDILKQRRGFDRSVGANTIYERNYNTLGRYALLSFTWNFTKNPGTPTK